MKLNFSVLVMASVCFWSPAVHPANIYNLTSLLSSVFLIDCTENREATMWRATNDGVMGGESQGEVLFRDQACEFSGTISLENNGGFSSVNRTVEPLPQGLNTVAVEIAGDGGVYQLRLAVYLNGYRIAYKHDFETVAGRRETLRFSLADFQASYRGRVINGAPELRSEDIRQVGFLITRKQPGPFALSVYNLTIFGELKV